MLGPKVIPFCRRGKCCPVVTVAGDRVTIGGEEEGITKMSLGQFQDFITTVKEGKFDEAIQPRGSVSPDGDIQPSLFDNGF